MIFADPPPGWSQLLRTAARPHRPGRALVQAVLARPPIGDHLTKRSRLFFAFSSAAILPHVPNKRLAAFIYLHMLDADKLRAAVS